MYLLKYLLKNCLKTKKKSFKKKNHYTLNVFSVKRLNIEKPKTKLTFYNNYVFIPKGKTTGFVLYVRSKNIKKILYFVSRILKKKFKLKRAYFVI